MRADPTRTPNDQVFAGDERSSYGEGKLFPLWIYDDSTKSPEIKT